MQYSKEITCPECMKILGDKYLVPASQNAQSVHWDEKEGHFVIARNTEIVISQDWRQENSGKVAIWKEGLKIKLRSQDGQVVLYNLENKRALPLSLCKLSCAVYEIKGPGAEQHIKEDRVDVLEYQLKQEATARQEAEKKLKNLTLDNRIDSLKRRFDAIGFEVKREFGFPNMPGKRIAMSCDVAENIVSYLECTMEKSKNNVKISDSIFNELRAPGKSEDEIIEVLDELVHDLASKIGSGVNNGGLFEQIMFIVEQCGEQAREQIHDFLNSKKP